MRIGLILVASATLYCGFASTRSVAEEPSGQGRPNFVVIVTDDMGYSDPSCYGGEIQTPNIDGLAANGVRFSEFYNCSRCCQSRASLLTGMYPQRVGMAEFGRTLETNVPTLAETLRETGYSTAMVGKWHLSELPDTPKEAQRVLWMNHEIDLDIPFAEIESYPSRRGFDRFYGTIWGVVNHFDPFSLVDGEKPVRSVPKDFYATDAISDRSVEYIRDFANSDGPFFLYVSYTAPHWPIQAPADEIAKYRGRYAGGWDALRRERFKRQQEIGLFGKDVTLGAISGRQRKWEQIPESQREYEAAKMEVHSAMVDFVDQGIGRIVESLRATGQLNNTVIFFLSDNGASPEIPGTAGYDRYGGTRDGREALRDTDLRLPENRHKLGSDESFAGIGPAWASASNTPLRFWKMDSYEGGCRTPLIIHWPDGLKAASGSFVREFGHIVDIAPTCLDLANAQQLPNTIQDGISLTPLFAGRSLPNDRTLYFAHMDGRGIRQGNWKAVRRTRRAWELFDIEKDPGETHNLADVKLDLLNSLVNEWTTWDMDVNEHSKKRISTLRPSPSHTDADGSR